MYNTVNVNTNAMNVNETAFLLTAYETVGSVNEDDLVKLLADELDIDDDVVNAYFEYLWENDPDRALYTDLDIMLEGMTPTDAARAVYFGNIKNWCDDYFRFNGYGNIESLSEYELIKEIADNDDFKRDYVRNNVLDDYDVDGIIEECNKLIKAGY